ncbi:MAG: hypothetical protein ACUVR3_07980, partial [Candidatus Roseilinea sp.]|uniref:hypothetical protein n=1 Tax=Candidatus Roseilinea sp. TaxID=2838777 RepID=UPI00404932C2
MSAPIASAQGRAWVVSAGAPMGALQGGLDCVPGQANPGCAVQAISRMTSVMPAADQSGFSEQSPQRSAPAPASNGLVGATLAQSRIAVEQEQGFP